MKKINIEIQGIAPLLHSRFPTENFGINKSKEKRKVINIEEVVKKALYLDAKGQTYQPAEQIYQSMIKASVDFKFEGKKTYKDVITTGIFIEPEAIPLPYGYEVDARPFVNKTTRGRDITYRPRFNEWKCKFTINIIDDKNISISTLKEILERAGQTKGIGTYRPRFGRFMVTSFQEMDGSEK